METTEEQQLGIGSKVDHPSFGLGIIVDQEENFYKIYFSKEENLKSIGKNFAGMKIVDRIEPESKPIDLDDFEKVMTKVFIKYVDPPQRVPLGSKWIGGTMTLNPGDPDLSGKEIPIEAFFHKIVLVRDRLRVLEQNINSNKKLDDEDKVNLQQYITRVYGSLTTFNVLFNHKDYYFKGEGRKE